MIHDPLLLIGLYFPYHCNIFFVSFVNWSDLVFLTMTSFCKCLYLRRFLPTVEMTQPLRAAGGRENRAQSARFSLPHTILCETRSFRCRICGKKSIPSCHNIMCAIFFWSYDSGWLQITRSKWPFNDAKQITRSKCRKNRNLRFHLFSSILEKLQKSKIFYFSGWLLMTRSKWL